MRQMNRDLELDQKLTDFTDRVLAGKSARPDSTAGEELRRLEETIIRLKRALPRSESEEDALQQIETRLTARLRQEAKNMAHSYSRRRAGWNWKFGRSRLVPAVLGWLLILLVALASTFMFPSGSSGVAATAFTSARVALIAIMLTGLLLVLIWIQRRK